MTTSMEGRPADPAMPPVGADSYVIRPDGAAGRRMLRFQVVLAIILVPGNLLLALGADSRGELALRLVTAASYALLVPWQVRIWRRFIAADALGVIGPTGIRINDLGRGWVALPWDAVVRVRSDLWGRVVVKVAKDVGPGSPGTEWPASRGTVRRAHRKGLFIFTRQSDAAPNQVLAAVTHFSGGRL